MSYTANTTVPNLQAATAVSDTDLVVVNQGGVTKRAAVSVIENKVLSAKSLLSGATSNTDRVMVRRGTTTHDVALSDLLPAASVGSNQIADNAVTGSELQNSAGDDNARAVSTNHVKNRSITGAKIATNTILQEHLAQDSVGDSQLQDLAIASRVIRNGAVVQTHLSANTVSYFGVSGVRGEVRPLNPWSTFIGAPSTELLAWPGQADKLTEAMDLNYILASTLKNHETFNRYCDWFLSVQECGPTFIGHTAAGVGSDSMKGGAYSGGVLLPDGKVFLVPYNAGPAIYDPVKDTLTNLAWPGGALPFAAPYYAGYSGAVLLSAPPSVSGVNGARSGELTPAFNEGPIVVCAPFFAKRALIYNVQTGVCAYGNTVSSLPNRAFGGIVALGPDKLKSGNRVAVAVPHATGKPYLIDSNGTLTVSNSADRTSGYGAGFNSNTDVAFGTSIFTAAAEDTTTSGWTSGNTDFPELAVSSDGTTRLVTVNQSTGHFLINGDPSKAIAKTPMPSGGAVQGYRVSGLVRMPDGYIMAVPGYWGQSYTPSVLLFNSQAAQSSSPPDAIAIPVPGLQANIPATGNFANTPAPGNGLFSGGVLLPDGRVFLVPCTSTKAYIISTRRPVMPLPEEIALGPYFNKR